MLYTVFIQSIETDKHLIRFSTVSQLGSHGHQPQWLSWMHVRLVIRRLSVDPRHVGNNFLWRFDHEIFSAFILSLLLIQEVHLSVSGKRMCTILVSCLEDWACPIKVWSGKLTVLDMTQLHCLFVCVEVLRPSQPNGVMSSAVSLPNHTFTGQVYPLRVQLH